MKIVGVICFGVVVIVVAGCTPLFPIFEEKNYDLPGIGVTLNTETAGKGADGFVTGSLINVDIKKYSRDNNLKEYKIAKVERILSKGNVSDNSSCQWNGQWEFRIPSGYIGWDVCVAVTVANNKDSETYFSEKYLIKNQEPEISEAVITANEGVIHTGSVLTANITAVDNDEGDVITVIDITWQVALDNTADYEKIMDESGDLTTQFDYSIDTQYNKSHIRFKAVVYDNNGGKSSEETFSDWIYVTDSTPDITGVTIYHGDQVVDTAHVGDTLTAIVDATDDDGDVVDTVITWYCADETIDTTGDADDILNIASKHKGKSIYCIVSVEGMPDIFLESNKVFIEDRGAAIDRVEILCNGGVSDHAYAGDTLHAVIDTSDPDAGDVVDTDIRWYWVDATGDTHVIAENTGPDLTVSSDYINGDIYCTVSVPGNPDVTPDIDSIYIENCKPRAENIVVTRTDGSGIIAAPGHELTVSYDLTDDDGDMSLSAAFAWYYVERAATPASFGNTETVTIPPMSDETEVYCVVTPVDSHHDEGTIGTSDAITIYNTNPRVVDLTIDVLEAPVLRADFLVTDDHGYDARVDMISWYYSDTSDDPSYTKIPGATGMTFDVSGGYYYKYIKCGVTPEDEFGASGSESVCDPVYFERSSPYAEAVMKLDLTSDREFYEVQPVGNKIYAANGANGLAVIDRDTLVVETTIILPGVATDVSVNGNYAFVADNFGGGVQVVDLVPPIEILADKSGEPNTSVKCIAIYNNTLYASTPLQGFYEIFDDITNVAKNIVPIDTAGMVSRFGTEICIIGHNAYIARNTNGGSGSNDITRKINLNTNAVSTIGGTNDADGIAPYGSYVFLAALDSGIQVIDDTSNDVSIIPVASTVNDVYVYENWLLAACTGTGVVVYDVTDIETGGIASVREMHTITDSTFTYSHISADDTYIYISGISQDGTFTFMKLSE